MFESIFATLPQDTRNPAEFASAVEKELFDLFGEPDPKGRKAPRVKYVARFRSLHFTLKSNDYFRSRIATGELDPAAIVRSEGDDLLTPEQKRAAESMREKSMKDSVKVHMAAPIAKRTHKGEEVIDSFGVDDRMAEKERERRKEEEERAKQSRRSLSVSLQGQGSGGSPLSIEVPRVASPATAALSPSGESARPEAPLSPIERRRRTSSGVVLQPEDLGLGDEAATESLAAETEKPVEEDGATRAESDQISKKSFNLDSIWTSFKAPPVVPGSSAAAEGAQKEDEDGSDAMDEGTPEPRGSPAGEAGQDDKPKLADDYDPFAFENEERGEAEEDLDALLHGDNKTTEPGSTTPKSPPPDTTTTPKKPRLLDLPSVWSGDLIMPDEGGFPAVAVQVAGRELGVSEEIWRTILPERLNIDGRVPTKVATDYLVQNTFATSREMAVVALLPDLSGPSLVYTEKPAADRVLAKQRHLIDYFVRKDRHGVVTAPEPMRRIVKDIYIVPLRATEQVPEFVELLDHRLGDAGERDKDMFIAVLVLQKNLIPAPAPTRPPPMTAMHQPPASYAPMPPASNPYPSYPPQYPQQSLPPPGQQPVLDQNLQSLLSNPALLEMVKNTQSAGGAISANPNLAPALNHDQGLLNNLASNPALLSSLLASQSQQQPTQQQQQGPPGGWGGPPGAPPPQPQWPPQQPAEASGSGTYFHPSRAMNDPERAPRNDDYRRGGGRGGWRGGGGGRGRGGDRDGNWRNNRGRGYR
jgi:hypothetical protein